MLVSTVQILRVPPKDLIVTLLLDVIINNMENNPYRRKGKLHPRWKGDDATYQTKHEWVQNNFGKPSLCEKCNKTDQPLYDWANISGKYIRKRFDWLRLCRKCHMKMDGRGHSKPILGGTSEYKGVSKNNRRWSARIQSGEKSQFIGNFSTQQEAAIAYNLAARLIHGPKAYLNPV